jgi:hypothetical protein
MYATLCRCQGRFSIRKQQLGHSRFFRILTDPGTDQEKAVGWSGLSLDFQADSLPHQKRARASTVIMSMLLQNGWLVVKDW